MKKILFIDRSQLGLITDYLMYCKILSSHYHIHYICFDMGKPKLLIPNVHVTYVPRWGNFTCRAILFLFYCLVTILFFNGFVFIANFPKCSILKRLLFWKRMHVDVRTLSVESTEEERRLADSQLIKDIRYFDSSSFISKGIQAKILQNVKHSYILPLGADVISNSNKSFNNLNLLYVGTLNNRHIIETVKGYVNFVKSHPNIKTHYDIVGDGINHELEEIDKFIKSQDMGQYITLHGRINYSELLPFFDSHNIGVSYIPITDYYQCQPPTKTYEYILSGLICLGTATDSNKEIINEKNGVLHLDNCTAFEEALEFILKNKDKYNSKIIRDTLIPYQWKNIIDKYLMPIIEPS